MASKQVQYSNSKRQLTLIIATVTITIALAQILTIVAALYIPDMHVARYRPVAVRRQDADDEDLDSGASSPSGEGSGATDGYEDGEPDGPYDETPRDEEGQADLERFFDDHLGASERDGMDKENLPTNLVPFVVANPQFASELERNIYLENDQQASGSQAQASLALASDTMAKNNPNNLKYFEHSNQHFPNIETRYMQLPNKKLIITRQITRGPVYKGGLDLSDVPAFFKLNDLSFNKQPEESLDANGSEIVATEDDDMDRVYVTKNTKKPFKIPALNGYDPEEDFQEASRDFEEPLKRARSGERRRSSEPEPEPELKDISFNDPETDTLFNDASETDEVIFSHDPYSVDLEAEIRGELPPQEQTSSAPEEDKQSDYEQQQQPSAQADSSAERPITRQRKIKSGDEDDGSWIDDGIEDMKVPSQNHQNSVLEKAAKQEELAQQAPPDEFKQQQGEQDPENQRMPNADYMKEDMNVDDPEDTLDD